MTRIRHVLLDADGVLQRVPGGLAAALEPFLGDRTGEFLTRAWADEAPTLLGCGDFLPLLATALADFGVGVPAGTIRDAVWHTIEVIDTTRAVALGLRQAGYGVHLATNQNPERAGYMRSALGYDRLFDSSLYSCDLGLAKPDPAFFLEASRRIGADPSAVLLIDDSAPNIAGARSVGMGAELWSHDQPARTLTDLLAAHGITLM